MRASTACRSSGTTPSSRRATAGLEWVRLPARSTRSSLLSTWTPSRRAWTRCRSSVPTRGQFSRSWATCPPRSSGSPRRAPSSGRLLLAGLYACSARQLLVNPRDPLYLPLGGETLIEALFPELLRHVAPGREALFPARHAARFRLGVVAREIGAHPHHRLDG